MFLFLSLFCFVRLKMQKSIINKKNKKKDHVKNTTKTRQQLKILKKKTK